jgi:hypothetical protein
MVTHPGPGGVVLSARKASAKKGRQRKTRGSETAGRKKRSATRQTSASPREKSAARKAAVPAARSVAELPGDVRRMLDQRVRAMVPSAPYVLDEEVRAELRATVLKRVPRSPDDPRYSAHLTAEE